MACKPGCNCFQCQAEKIKRRTKKENLDKVAQDFETKSGGIITKQDIYNIAEQYKKNK